MIRIVITEANPGMADGLRRQLPSSDFEIVGYARDGLEAAQLALRLMPDVLIVHEDLPEVSGYRVSELVNAATSDLGVLILTEDESSAVLRRAMASGARAVLAESAGAEKIVSTIREVAALNDVRSEPEYPLVTDPEQMPVSIAVTSARGGAGKTTIAANLAVLFAKRYPDRVVLVDFPGQFGDAAAALNVMPHDSIADLASFNELDTELVKTHLVIHPSSTLRLLSAPQVPLNEDLDLSRINVAFMASLIGHLRRSFRFVFFDMPPLIYPISKYVFSRCQQIVVITNLFDFSAISNSRAALQLAEESVGDADRVKLVANRSPRKGDYQLSDLEDTAGRKVYAQLADDFESASGALNTGEPAVLSYPRSALARGLTGLADQLIGEL